MTNVYGDQTVKSLQNIKHPGGAGVFSSSAWFPITSELLIFKNFFSYFIISSLCLLLFVPFVLDAFCPGCLHQNKQKNMFDGKPCIGGRIEATTSLALS